MSETDNDNDYIPSEDLDPNFKFEVAQELGGQQIKFCYQCGTCAAGCPIRTINKNFNPRTIIRKVLLGLRKEILSSKEIWMCSSCYTCYERCPQDVRITDVITAIRNIAVREGYAHPSYKKQVDLIGNIGRIYQVTDFETEEREDYNLPPIRPKTDEINKIFEKTKLKEKLKVSGD